MSITGVSRYHIMVRNPISLISAASPQGEYDDPQRSLLRQQQEEIQESAHFHAVRRFILY